MNPEKRKQFVAGLIRGTKEGKLKWNWYQNSFGTYLNYQKGSIARFHVYLKPKSVSIVEIDSTTRNDDNDFEVDRFKDKSLGKLYKFLKAQKKEKEKGTGPYDQILEALSMAIE